MVTTDIDYLLFEDDFSKLLSELKDKEELKISNNAVINSIEVDPFGWLSFNLYLKKIKHSILFEFINIADFEEKFENWKQNSHYKGFDWNKLLKPFVTKEEGYFEVVLYGYTVTPGKIHKFTISLGRNIYKLSKEVIK